MECGLVDRQGWESCMYAVTFSFPPPTKSHPPLARAAPARCPPALAPSPSHRTPLLNPTAAAHHPLSPQGAEKGALPPRARHGSPRGRPNKERGGVYKPQIPRQRWAALVGGWVDRVIICPFILYTKRRTHMYTNTSTRVPEPAQLLEPGGTEQKLVQVPGLQRHARVGLVHLYCA